MSLLVKKINATRFATYDVSKIVQDILDGDTERTLESITLDEVMNIVEEYSTEDLSSVYKEIIYTDEQGQEIIQ